MSTENENKQEGAVNEENQNVSREGGYKSYNRDNNYNRYNNDGEQRSYRPRTNSYGQGGGYNREGGDQQRSYRPSYNSGERSYNNNNGDRPSYNRYNNNNGDRPQRPYTPRPYNGNSEEGGEQRSYRPRTNSYGQGGGYNREGGDQERSYRPRTNSYGQGGGYNREGGDQQRPYRPSYNSNNGDRPAYNRYNNDNGDRPQRPYTPRPYNGGGEGGEQRSFRPRTNSYGQGGGDRSYRPRTNSYGQGGGYNRPYRPRTDDYNPNAKYSVKKQIEYKDVLTDPNEPIRLNKYLANAGVCSRREADEFITAGVVSVNGVAVTELGTKIKRTDEVKFHEKVVSVERKAYVLLNKPKDCVTTSDDPQERKTVMDFVKDACKERIYPVGRLDRNTTGVLLLTNDGDLASKLTHPKYLKKKIYHVFCDKNVTKADLDQIAAGVTLDDGEIHADSISYASDEDKSQVGIEIHSGKNRIVRRIFESLGYRVIKLDRVYFAGLTKKGLRRGDWRYLTEQEVNVLRMGAFE